MDIELIRRLVDGGNYLEALDKIAAVHVGGEAFDPSLIVLRLRALSGLGRWTELKDVGAAALAFFTQTRDLTTMSRIHGQLGLAHLRLGSMRQAESHLRAAIHILTWDLSDFAGALRHQRRLALMFHNLGMWSQARFELEKALETADEHDLPRESVGLRINLATTEIKSGHLNVVPDILDTATTRIDALGTDRLFLTVLSRLVRSNYMRITGNTAKAIDTLQPTLETCREQHYSREEAIALEYMGDCRLAKQEHRRALELYESAMAIAEATAPKGDLVPELCHRMAEVLVHLGDPNAAILLCERGLRIAQSIGDRYEECATHRPLAMAHRASGNPKKALRLADEGIELARSYEIPYELARMLLWAGETRLQEAGADEDAFGRRQLWEARGIFTRLGLPAWVRLADRTLGFEQAPASSEEDPAFTALRAVESIDRSALRFGLVTCDEAMREAIATVQSVAPSMIPVMIYGESGVGKELLAQALHQMSDRRRGPFIAVNCGAIPVGLMESELFGHERGAFTGAVQNREGLILSADGGTLFFDEIGELPAPVQASLLRVLESGELRAVGQDVVRKVNIRIVAATNADLENLVSRGVFRQDLYYRLNGVRVTLPPLRDREEDIRALFQYFWAQATAASKKTLHLSGEVEAMLCAYAWPGNVRELKHEVARVVAIAPDGSFVSPGAFLPHQMQKEVSVLRRGRVRRDQAQKERDEILEALRAHGGNKAEAARSLGGMKRTTLLYKMERLGIRPEEYEARE